MDNSAFGRLLSVLLSPERTFRSIAERPTVALALIVIILLGAGTNLLVFSKIDGEEMLRFQIEQSGRELTEQQMEAASSMGEKMKYISPVAALVLGPIIYLLMGAVFMVAFKLQGSELSFKESMSTCVYGTVPGAVKALLLIPIALGRAEIDFLAAQTQTLVASNLAAFAPEDASMTMISLLASADLFSVWTIILLAMGYRIVGRVSGATAGITVAVFWMIAVALKVGMTALGS